MKPYPWLPQTRSLGKILVQHATTMLDTTQPDWARTIATFQGELFTDERLCLLLGLFSHVSGYTSLNIILRRIKASCLFSTGAVARPRSFYGQGTGLVHLDDINCEGNEDTLINCNRRRFGSVGPNCKTHAELLLYAQHVSPI